MYKIKRPIDATTRESAVVDLISIRRSCHLFPEFPSDSIAKSEAKAWTSGNVLERCSVFFINNFVDLHAFQMIY